MAVYSGPPGSTRTVSAAQYQQQRNPQPAYQSPAPTPAPRPIPTPAMPVAQTPSGNSGFTLGKYGTGSESTRDLVYSALKSAKTGNQLLYALKGPGQYSAEDLDWANNAVANPTNAYADLARRDQLGNANTLGANDAAQVRVRSLNDTGNPQDAYKTFDLGRKATSEEKKDIAAAAANEEGSGRFRWGGLIGQSPIGGLLSKYSEAMNEKPLLALGGTLAAGYGLSKLMGGGGGGVPGATGGAGGAGGAGGGAASTLPGAGGAATAGAQTAMPSWAAQAGMSPQSWSQLQSIGSQIGGAVAPIGELMGGMAGSSIGSPILGVAGSGIAANMGLPNVASNIFNAGAKGTLGNLFSGGLSGVLGGGTAGGGGTAPSTAQTGGSGGMLKNIMGGGGSNLLSTLAGLGSIAGGFKGGPDSPGVGDAGMGDLRSSLKNRYMQQINAPEGFTQLDNDLLARLEERLMGESLSRDTERLREQQNLRGILHSTPAAKAEQRLADSARDRYRDAALALASDARNRQMQAMGQSQGLLGLGQQQANMQYQSEYQNYLDELKQQQAQQETLGRIAQPFFERIGLASNPMAGLLKGLF